MRIIIIRVIMNGNAPTNASPNPPERRHAPERPRATPRVASAELFSGGRELVIDHEGRQYCLRITQNGKLILTA